ncbi:MAG TPA: beta-ketoacyl-ACP synthase III [Candidatus Omnitrophota bacterium]|nr:ketoacyl-ACP synthase III [Candidatus Omnitrophota bacterium]HPN66111.1 beta-ketoacyl-ACP synthase III [Candidatus Omnitrophota bacterium]
MTPKPKTTRKRSNKVKAGIIGLGAYLPSRVMTNLDLEKLVETSDEWIRTRTGISERRIACKEEMTSDLAAHAAKAAIKDAKLDPKDIELIILATITPDMPFPATSCFVQAKIGAVNAACFDISAACSGFIHELTIAQQFIESGMYKNILVIGVELLSRFVDWKDRSTCVLFGDGAGAAVIAPVKEGGILSSYLGADGTKSGLLMFPAGGSVNPASHETVTQGLHFLKMEGNEVFKNAVRVMTDAVGKAIAKAGLSTGDIDCIIPHQANKRIIEAVISRIGIPTEKAFVNVEKYGNMSAASAIVALFEAVNEGRVKKGDKVLLVAFGSGFVWGSCVIEW